jgi:hypothetical protein
MFHVKPRLVTLPGFFLDPFLNPIKNRCRQQNEEEHN